MHPWARIREDRCLTQLEVSSILNVTRQTVIRLEQSLFHSPSEVILKELSCLYEVSEQELIEEYNEYVQQTREKFGEKYPNFNMLHSYNGNQHPLVYYREEVDLTRMGLCKGLCLDYGPVADFEYNKQRAIPEGLIVACQDIGWDYGILEKAVKRWRVKWR